MRARVLLAAVVASIGLLPVLVQGPVKGAEACWGTGVLNTPALQYALLGTPNSGPINGAPGLCSGGLGPAVIGGYITGNCDSAQGVMSINSRSASFVVIGRTITFTGPSWYGTGEWEAALGQSCLPPASASQFQITFAVTDTALPPTTIGTIPSVTVPTTSSTTSTSIPVPPLGGGAATNSTGCLGTPLHETTTPVYSKLTTYQPNPTTTYVCVRVADTPTGNGYGGRLEITTGGGGLPNPGLPTTDGDFDECGVAPNNSAPGPKPLVKGATAGVAYEVGIYQGPGVSGTGEAWVCLGAGPAQHRVRVPTGGTGLPGLPNVVWRPDTGTPG